MRKYHFILFLWFWSYSLLAQGTLPDSCKIAFGTNLSGLYDWGTEQPFVDMMKACRNWYSKDDSGEFDSGLVDKMSFRNDGYPTHIPQTLPGVVKPQYVATIWARIGGWKVGDYKVFFDGNGEIDINFGVDNFKRLDDHTYSFYLPTNINREIQLILVQSSASDPIRNIRIIHKDFEQTYQTQIFNPTWLAYLRPFKSIRFMDWGHTNFWGQKDDWTWEQDSAVWSSRARVEDYTWTSYKGIPYEIMIQLMNELQVDGWVCIPHTAGDDYIKNMARLFRTNLSASRHLYVEYSNEVWNWIFGQTVWLDEKFCKPSGTWPECYVPAIQRALDVWTAEYGSEINRVTRVLGAFTGWYDVSERVANTMRLNSYDAIAPTFYFGLSQESDERLDVLGSAVTVRDLAGEVRSNFSTEFNAIVQIKNLAKRLNKKLVFYEGGNHITAHPFGVEPSYGQALIDLHRDTAIYNLYNEWLSLIKTLQSGTDPLICENFSFIADRSSRYGSWGLFESLYQDTVAITPYKYRAVMEHQSGSCIPTSTHQFQKEKFYCSYKPLSKSISLSSSQTISYSVIDLQGKVCKTGIVNAGENEISLSSLPPSVYFLKADNMMCKVFVE